LWFICLACWKSLTIHFITLEQFSNKMFLSHLLIQASHLLFTFFVFWSLSKHFPLKNFLFLNTVSLITAKACEWLGEVRTKGNYLKHSQLSDLLVDYTCWSFFVMTYFYVSMLQGRQDIKIACEHSLDKNTYILCCV
jgi:hypothetical protein